MLERLQALLVAGLLLISGFPQAPPAQSSGTLSQGAPAPAAQAPPAVRVTTRMVQVNVIVHDRDGKPIAGLRKSDFHLFDQGQPQTISYFSEQSSHLTSTPAPTPAPNLFSNRAEEQTGVPTSVTVILLDWLNTGLLTMAYARPQVIKFLRTQIQPQDRVAIYGLSYKTLFILHDFTNDSAALLSALDRATKKKAGSLQGKGAAAPDSDDARLDAFLAEAESHPHNLIVDQVGTTSNALKVIAGRLANIPGRKNLVWVSSAFPSSIGYSYRMSLGTRSQGRFPASRFNQQTTDAARALSNANVAIYPVDARGLIPNQMQDISHNSMGPAPEQFDTMVALARATGGQAFYNNNDIRGAIRRAIDDSRVTYVLGYYPTHNEWNGEFRGISVKTDRKALDLRYRNGYFASPAGDVDPNRRQQLLSDAATSPLESTAIGVDVQAEAVDLPGARQIKAQVHVDPGGLVFEEKDGNWKDDVEVIWVELNKEGREIGTHSQMFNLHPERERYEFVLKNGLNFFETLTLTPEVAEVRLIISESGAGAIGSVNIPLSRIFTQAGVQGAPK
ncbi:MAG: VWA domain-containing protein [Candidatus Acidiferrales bacterium]